VGFILLTTTSPGRRGHSKYVDYILKLGSIETDLFAPKITPAAALSYPSGKLRSVVVALGVNIDDSVYIDIIALEENSLRWTEVPDDNGCLRPYANAVPQSLDRVELSRWLEIYLLVKKADTSKSEAKKIVGKLVVFVNTR
jgi:hypothetical protein